ncbi:winged helix-turn-helix domain-containing protein [Acuticoccus yangtzensis]|uniref:winged helix-turn-helix domain-containing protein n=1 Tax=Acuticoccus yangtzensis TaxID=1443441 RepID=UPI00094987DE|nr:winged helix-turn-helix domain-containing protein [Acuticoccus yangtzensis]
MTIPDDQALMLPVLQYAARGISRVPDMAARAAEEFALTREKIAERLPSGRQEVLNNPIHSTRRTVKIRAIDENYFASEDG